MPRYWAIKRGFNFQVETNLESLAFKACEQLQKCSSLVGKSVPLCNLIFYSDLRKDFDQ